MTQASTDEATISRTRKRLRREATWKKKTAQKLRNSGKEYVGDKGVFHQARSVKDYIHNCRFKCNQNFPQGKRQVIFEQYWNLASWNLQTAFINSCVEKVPTKRPQARAKKHKNSSSILTLQENGVCKEFFFKNS